LPGFLAGLCYAVVVSIAGRRRPLRDIRLAEVAGWGVTGGLLLSAIPALALLDNGPSDAPNGDWRIPAAIAVLITFSVASAVGSFVLAQRAARADDRRLRERLTDVLTGAAASTAALPPVHGTVSPGFDDSQRTRESSAARGRP
jgi:MFS family permease